jgi:peptide/nickel transport system permease protein
MPDRRSRLGSPWRPRRAAWQRAAPLAAGILATIVLASLAAPWIAPQNPHDLASLYLENAELPPVWHADGQWPFLLGTDAQGRDVASAILYGARTSLAIGFASVGLALLLGVAVGLVAGYYRGVVDTIAMRVADVFLSLPTLLVAVFVSAIGKQWIPGLARPTGSAALLVLAIALGTWVQFARTARASTMVERDKGYVLAARVMRVPGWRILLSHVLPNAWAPLLVVAALNVGVAMLSEATLSFLGVGMPADQPSLGTLIRNGSDFLYAGMWWVVVWPVAVLGVIVVAVNLLGDRLRDALDPRRP